METCLVRTNGSLKRLEQLRKATVKEFNKTAQYFGENPKKIGMQQFFKIFEEFTRKFEVFQPNLIFSFSCRVYYLPTITTINFRSCTIATECVWNIIKHVHKYCAINIGFYFVILCRYTISNRRNRTTKSVTLQNTSQRALSNNHGYLWFEIKENDLQFYI